MTRNERLFLFGLMPALVFQVIGAFFYFDIWPTQVLGKATYLATKILLLIWPLLWWKSLSTPLRLRPQKILFESLYGLGSGLLLSLCLLLIFFVLPNKELLSTQIHSKAEAYLDLNLGFYIIFSIFLSLGHSLLEEYYWRWFLGKGLQSKGNYSLWTALILTNAAFSAHHFIVLNALVELPWAIFGTIAVFLAGITWSLLYEKTNSIFASWLSHACVDATIMAIGYSLLF